MVYLAYAYNGNILSYGPVFTSLALFCYLSYYGIFFFNTALEGLAAFRVLCKRMNEVLLLPEFNKSQENKIEELSISDEDITPNIYIKMGDIIIEEAYLNWEEGEGRAEANETISLLSTNNNHVEKMDWGKWTLDNVSCTFPSGKLTGIFGPVAGGKSTILLAILGELGLQSGTVRSKGRIAYCSQEPLIIHGTILENILFGSEYNAVYYIYIYIYIVKIQ